MGKKAKGFSLLLVALLLMCLASSIVRANFKPSPLPAVHINSNGEISPSFNLIQRNGDVYTFTGNWTTCFLQVDRSNIVIQGGGFFIIGNTVGWGIRLLEVSNVSIYNVNVEKTLIGIYFEKSSRVTIDSCKANVGNDGIYLNQSQSNTILNNKLSAFSGIYLDHSGNNVLKNNSIQASSKSFMVTGDSLAEYMNNIDSSNLINGKSIIYWVGRQNAVVPSNSSYVTLVNCKEIIVQNQQISNTQGILLAWTTNSIVGNNYLNRNFYGIQVLYSSNIMIRGNQIWDNNGLVSGGDGINLDHSQFVTVENNQLAGNWNGGVTFINSSKNQLIGNSISESKHNGINLLSSSDYNFITENHLFNITPSSRGAIYIENSRNDNFVLNNLTDNGCWAIQLKGSQGDNTFYGNNFLHNSYWNTRDIPGALQISTPGTANGNNWDNGSLGNYWSDYNGSGKYFINENNIDHYPLSQQVDINAITPIPTINTESDQVSINPITVAFLLSAILTVLILLILIYRRR
jgi:parallel beta-helix repeat protein